MLEQASLKWAELEKVLTGKATIMERKRLNPDAESEE